jgi:hypothetical protein
LSPRGRINYASGCKRYVSFTSPSHVINTRTSLADKGRLLNENTLSSYPRWLVVFFRIHEHARIRHLGIVIVVVIPQTEAPAFVFVASNMDLITPLRNITLSSIVVPFVYNYALSRSSRFIFSIGFWGIVYVIWIAQFTLWAFYRIILRPKFLSPLRKLPEPTVGSRQTLARLVSLLIYM